MSEQEQERHRASSEPERYMRTNITRNANGTYKHETTVSVRWVGSRAEGNMILAELLEDADAVCRWEIDRRKAKDAEGQE